MTAILCPEYSLSEIALTLRYSFCSMVLIGPPRESWILSSSSSFIRQVVDEAGPHRVLG